VFETIELRREKNRATILLSRPRVMNAFTELQWAELGQAMEELQGDDTCRAIVIRGKGGNFSTGYDLPAALKDLEGASEQRVREHIRPGNEACWAAWRSPKPVIAAVEGYCLGGAFELAMACDFVLAEEDAKFGEPEGRVGASAPFLVTPWIAGMRHAKEILLLGEMLTATRAEQMGLVNLVCSKGALDQVVDQWCDRLSGFSAQVWAANKRTVNRSFEIMGFAAAIEMGEDAFTSLCFVADEFKSEFFERVNKDGFSAAAKWAFSRR
jgi:enoyl-CoA hydratase